MFLDLHLCALPLTDEPPPHLPFHCLAALFDSD